MICHGVVKVYLFIAHLHMSEGEVEIHSGSDGERSRSSEDVGKMKLSAHASERRG